MEQMKEQADKIELIRHKIEDADAIVIGAGAGLSTAAGFTYSGDRRDHQQDRQCDQPDIRADHSRIHRRTDSGKR